MKRLILILNGKGGVGKSFFAVNYVQFLKDKGIAHVAIDSDNENSTLKRFHPETLALPGSRTNPNLCAVRFLLTPGRKYEEAVSTFKPYTKIKEIDREARIAARGLIADAIAAGPKQKTMLYVNNRLEGNALQTIDVMLEAPN
jgi:CO dehydrogenase nickel-insertion accessory protein CooC1